MYDKGVASVLDHLALVKGKIGAIFVGGDPRRGVKGAREKGRGGNRNCKTIGFSGFGRWGVWVGMDERR